MSILNSSIPLIYGECTQSDVELSLKKCMPQCISIPMPVILQQVHQSTYFPYYVGFWSTKEEISQNPTVVSPDNRYEAKGLNIYHKMIPYVKEISKLDGYISPDMRRTIHKVISVLHEKVFQSVIEQNLAKYGTSNVQADRFSTLKQKYSSTFVTYAQQNIDN